ncbi:DUF4433 domain-containing protein [Thermosipho ferrireducens]|nr:DUF4433 domain-containing protein [Thermosipho ferrireducens]
MEKSQLINYINEKLKRLGYVFRPYPESFTYEELNFIFDIFKKGRIRKIENIKFLYYIVPIENLENIIKSGKIECRNNVLKKGKRINDPSDKNVQKRRAEKYIYRKYNIHNFVGLYINPRNAMLYRYIVKKVNFAVLQISNRILEDFRHIFYSYKNASASDAQISENPRMINLNIKKIMSDSWKNDDNLKKIIQSEVLVLGYVPLKYVKRIFVKDANLGKVKSILKRYPYKIPVETKCYHIKDLFFESWLRSD